MGSGGSKIGRRMTRGISGKWKTSEGGGGCSSNHFSASMPPGGGLNNYCGGGTSDPHNTPPYPRRSLPHSSWPLALLYQAAAPFIAIETRTLGPMETERGSWSWRVGDGSEGCFVVVVVSVRGHVTTPGPEAVNWDAIAWLINFKYGTPSPG